MLLGLFTAEAPLPGSDEPRYYNTVVALGDSDLQLYRKRHLVPFGETIPLKPLVGWFIRPGARDPARRPDARRARRSRRSPSPDSASRVNICYEDAFGAS